MSEGSASVAITRLGAECIGFEKRGDKVAIAANLVPIGIPR
jgi:hypothetical protein